jgi:cell division protease FtsH
LDHHRAPSGALFNLFQGPHSGRAVRRFPSASSISRCRRRIKSVNISGTHVEGQFKNGTQFSTDIPDDPSLTSRLLEHNVDIKVRPEGDNITLLSVFINWFPMLLFVAVMIFLMRQMQAGGGKAMGFGKSRAKMLTERQGRVTFEDVAGVDEAKEDLVEIVDFLKDPQKFQKLGGRIPKGVLLVGPPGTGKTLLARAIAGEANVPFFTISGLGLRRNVRRRRRQPRARHVRAGKEERAVHRLHR